MTKFRRVLFRSEGAIGIQHVAAAIGFRQELEGDMIEDAGTHREGRARGNTSDHAGEEGERRTQNSRRRSLAIRSGSHV